MDLHRLGHPIDDSQETDDCQPTDGFQETKETRKAIAELLRKLRGMGMEKPQRLYAIPGRASEEKKELKIGRRRL
jgi:hypothetical protein